MMEVARDHVILFFSPVLGRLLRAFMTMVLKKARPNVLGYAGLLSRYTESGCQKPEWFPVCHA